MQHHMLTMCVPVLLYNFSGIQDGESLQNGTVFVQIVIVFLG